MALIAFPYGSKKLV